MISRKAIRGIEWPPRSPDLNPLDFYLWGYLKSIVYTPLPRTLDDLQQNIEEAVRNLDVTVIKKAIRNVRHRARMCLQANGGYFEG